MVDEIVGADGCFRSYYCAGRGMIAQLQPSSECAPNESSSNVDGLLADTYGGVADLRQRCKIASGCRANIADVS
jgi:hypothetical protein